MICFQKYATSCQEAYIAFFVGQELCEMDADGILGHRCVKFRELGGFTEGGMVEPERKRNMKKKEADLSQVTAEIELEIENLKKAAGEAKGKSLGLIKSEEAIEQLKQEVDKEITNAFISIGLQEKLEAVKMELSKSPADTNDQALNPALKEKIDRLVQEFNHALSRPGSFLSLKQKLEMLSEVNRLVEQKRKGEGLKKEINEKLQADVKEKMEILRKARDIVAKGEQLSEDLIKEVDRAKEDIMEMLKSVNVEVLGIAKKKVPTGPPGLEEKLAKADEVVRSEIEKAIDMTGLRGKIEELKAEIGKGSNKEKVDELAKEIREGIAAVIDIQELKRKIACMADLPVQEAVGADNGRG